ncbi:MAG: glycoside hydrolase family 26 protein [Chloroflexota bacterium]
MFVAVVGVPVVGPARMNAAASERQDHPGARAKVALGVYIADQHSEVSGSSALIRAYTKMVGARPAILMWYQTWSEHPNSFPTQGMNAARAQCMLPMLTWEPGAGRNPDPTYKLSRILNGAFDSFVKRFAIEAKNWGHPFMLRFAPEMNGNWFSWGAGPNAPNGNSPAQVVAVWRHIYDLFLKEGATNVIWVWSPNVSSKHSPDLKLFYPGDAYVDWVGLDGYNDGTALRAGHSGWQSFTQIFGTSYADLANLTKKPIMIAETASAEFGGNKSVWIKNAFFRAIPNKFPRVRAVIWFDKAKETDWRVNSSPRALAAFRQVAADPLYSRHFACS